VRTQNLRKEKVVSYKTLPCKKINTEAIISKSTDTSGCEEKKKIVFGVFRPNDFPLISNSV
jgi:hypothetical protein